MALPGRRPWVDQKKFGPDREKDRTQSAKGETGLKLEEAIHSPKLFQQQRSIVGPGFTNSRNPDGSVVLDRTFMFTDAASVTEGGVHVWPGQFDLFPPTVSNFNLPRKNGLG